jgi:hypothetical protein
MNALTSVPGGAVPFASPFSLAAGLAAALAGASARQIAGRTRAGRLPLARAQAVYLGHVALGVPLVHAAAAMGRDRASARRACARIEARRDAPAQDHALACLEAGLRALRESLAQHGEGRP